MKKSKFLSLIICLCLSASMFAQDAEQAETVTNDNRCNEYISLYREYFKQWEAGKYKAEALNPEMIPAWRSAFLNCPSLREQTYLDGVKIMQYLIKKEKNAALKEAYIDTLIMVYDRRAEFFPNTKKGASQIGNIMGRKGVDIVSYAPDRFETAYDALKMSVDLDGNNAQSAILDAYFLITAKMTTEEKIEPSVIIDTYNQISDIISFNITKYTEAENEKQVTNYTNVRNNVDGRFEPFAKCEDLVRIFTPKVAAEPDNTELLQKVCVLLDRSNCTSEALFLDASIKLYKIQPSPESAFLIGRRLLIESKYNEALPYFKEAINSENVDRKISSYEYLAQIYMFREDYPTARDMARKAIQLNPKDGDAYILIGRMYAASAKDCGNGDFYGKVAYWAAVDKFQKAKEVDPSVAKKADELIRGYQSHFPTIEAIFFNDFAEGASYTVGCWINETTTIRQAK